MFIKKLIIGILCFYTVDTRRLYTRSEIIKSTHDIEYSLENRKKREEERRRTRSYKNKKWSERKKYRIKNYALKGTKAKDKRYSNQQKIRRMYRNS